MGPLGNISRTFLVQVLLRSNIQFLSSEGESERANKSDKHYELRSTIEIQLVNINKRLKIETVVLIENVVDTNNKSVFFFKENYLVEYFAYANKIVHPDTSSVK